MRYQWQNPVFLVIIFDFIGIQVISVLCDKWDALSLYHAIKKL